MLNQILQSTYTRDALHEKLELLSAFFEEYEYSNAEKPDLSTNGRDDTDEKGSPSRAQRENAFKNFLRERGKENWAQEKHWKKTLMSIVGEGDEAPAKSGARPDEISRQARNDRNKKGDSSHAQREPSRVISRLKKTAENLPIVRLKIPVPPTEEMTEEIGSWVRREVSDQALIDLEVEPEILLGAGVSWKGQYMEYSLREKLQRTRDQTRPIQDKRRR